MVMAGPFLIVTAPPQAAEAIVVIGGDHKPARMQKAVELFQQGYAPTVIISAGTTVLEGGTWMAEAEVMRGQALALGLPEAVILLEVQSKSTHGNARYSKELCLNHGVDSILLVTSAYHSRRAYRIFRERFEPDISVTIQAAEVDYWAIWWPLYPDQAYVVGYEYYQWTHYWRG